MNATKDVEKLLASYVAWLKDKTKIKTVENDWIEITTPFLDRHNDYLQIYTKKIGNEFQLTDDGAILEDLLLSGCDVSTPKRRKLLEITLNGLGVELSNRKLLVKASQVDFPQKKHDLIQAMLAVNDMFFLAQPTVTSVFFEDVSEWFDESQIRYSPHIRFSGKSGFTHSFDFVIPKSSIQPERIVQLLNKPSRSNAEKLAFTWIDTKEIRNDNTKAFAFLNDQVPDGLDEVEHALKKYEIKPIRWSKRTEIRDELFN